MSMHVKEVELAPGDASSEAWLEVHHAADRAVWGHAAQHTSIEEVVDVVARRHEARRTFAVLEEGSDVVVGAAQTIRRTPDSTARHTSSRRPSAGCRRSGSRTAPCWPVG